MNQALIVVINDFLNNTTTQSQTNIEYLIVIATFIALKYCYSQCLVNKTAISNSKVQISLVFVKAA